jgi:hypothetical protein
VCEETAASLDRIANALDDLGNGHDDGYPHFRSGAIRGLAVTTAECSEAIAHKIDYVAGSIRTNADATEHLANEIAALAAAIGNGFSEVAEAIRSGKGTDKAIPIEEYEFRPEVLPDKT